MVLFHFPVSFGILRCLGLNGTERLPGWQWLWSALGHSGMRTLLFPRLCRPIRPPPMGSQDRSQTPWDPPTLGLPSRGQAWRGSPWLRG